MCRGGLHVSARIVLFAICGAFPDRDAMACSDVEWQCPLDGKCILKEYVCDEYAPADCSNGEDEQAEFCQTWKYPADVTATATPGATAIADTTTLSTTTATATEGSGDGAHEDAGWGAGEKSQLEQQQECNQNDWKCPSDGTCIYEGFVCDYFDPPDCPNGDDEDEHLCSKWKGGTTTVTGTSTTTTVSTTTETQTTTTTSTVSTTTETQTTTTTATFTTVTASTTTATTTTATTTTTLSTTSTTTTQPAGCCIIVLPESNELSCIDRWTEIKCDALASRLLATGSRGSATEFAAETACRNLPASCPHNSTTTTTTTATSSGTTTTMTSTSRTTTTTTLAATGCCIIRSNDPELSCVDDFTAAECSSLETRMVAVGSISSTFLSLAVECKSLPTTCPQGSTAPTTPLRGCCIVTSHDPQLICVDELSAAECSSLEKRMISAGSPAPPSTTLALGAACVDLPAVCPQGSTTITATSTTATSTTVSSTTRTSTTAPAGCCIVTSADPALSCFDNFTETNCAALESRIRKAGGGGSTSFAVANACKHFRDVCPQGTPAIRCSKSDGCSPPLKYCLTSEQLFNGKHQCVECSQQTFLANGGCTYRLTCKGPTYTQTQEKCTCRHAKEEGGGVEKNCHRCHVYKTERDQSYRARNVASSNNNHVAKFVKCYGCSNGFYFHNGSCIRRDSCLARGMAAYDASGSGYRNYCDSPFTCYKKKRTNGPKAGEGCKCRRNWPLKRRCTRCDWGVSGVDYACTDP